jgi:hypothetical protein
MTTTEPVVGSAVADVLRHHSVPSAGFEPAALGLGSGRCTRCGHAADLQRCSRAAVARRNFGAYWAWVLTTTCASLVLDEHPNEQRVRHDERHQGCHMPARDQAVEHEEVPEEGDVDPSNRADLLPISGHDSRRYSGVGCAVAICWQASHRGKPSAGPAGRCRSDRDRMATQRHGLAVQIGTPGSRRERGRTKGGCFFALHARLGVSHRRRQKLGRLLGENTSPSCRMPHTRMSLPLTFVLSWNRTPCPTTRPGPSTRPED